ncbi:MAG TPA: hypothetical protein VN667_21255, partial [Burkholderiales bacterium]|nr:hypothetical protein [Burkholderiales bacterium]
MGRPRKKDTKLPAYVRIRFGSYLYKDKKLCRADAGESAMYEALAKLLKGLDISTVPAAVAIFKLEYLPTLKASSRTEHAALLDIFADEFEDFRVDQVRAHHIKAACKARFPDAPTRARHFKSRVSTFFRWCIADKGMVQINPCKDVWLEKPVTRKTPWTPALFWAVRDHLTPMYQCYHDLSYLLYQRTTDVRWLLKEQVRESEGVIHFEPTKTARSSGRAVDIPITPAIKAVLDRAKELS